jgi:hypothetical protein
MHGGVIRANTTRDRVDESPRVYDPRDRDDHDPRDGLMRSLDLPRRDRREMSKTATITDWTGEDSRTRRRRCFDVPK